MKPTALVLLGLGLVLGGCTASSDAEEAEEAASDSAELVSGPGITLRATDDPALELNVKIADGVQPTTINQRFFKLTASRAGKSFSSWCKGIGSVGERGVEQGIECYDSVSTVSGDDDEGFAITLRKRDGAYEIASVEYGGDGTFYGDRMKILQPSWTWVPHSPADIQHVALEVKRGEGTPSDPFPMIEKVGTRLASVLGEEIPNHQTRPLAARSIEFQLFTSMEVHAKLVLSQSGWTTASADNVSVLRTPGKLSSGLASSATVKARVLDNLD